MGVTGVIVLALIVLGMLALLIWLARTLPMSTSDIVLLVLVGPGLCALVIWLARAARMGATEVIVLTLIGVGVYTLVIWLAEAWAPSLRGRASLTPAAAVQRDLAHRSTPAKLGWNWWAFFLGPFWFLARGLWVHAFILFSLLLLSAGILLPFVMLYGGLKANETLEDFRLARHTVY